MRPGSWLPGLAGCLTFPAAGMAVANALPPPPLMQLETQFRGPFEDTVIQRWRDPQTGVLCYLYVPVRVENQRAPSGGVAYGANTLGSLSCLAPPAGPSNAMR